MASLTGKLVSETYKALLKMIDNDILSENEKQISDGYGQGTGIFIDDNGFIRATSYKVTGGNSSQFLKGDGTLDSNSYLTAAAASALYLPIGSTTSAIAEGSRLYFTEPRVLATVLTGFVSTEGTVTAADSILSAINKIWWNIENGGGGGGGYVPYTGATQNLNLGTYGLISDYIQFNLAPTSIPTTAGTMSWNAADGTADLKMGGANVTLQVGQEELVRVVNKTGANLLEANYQAVRISGAQGNRLKVSLAKADVDANSADTIGLVTETINDNQEGFVTSVGLVRNIDTTGDLQTETWADGDMLYLSAATAGKITNVKPQAPEHGVRMGYVVRAHKTQGQIYVKVDNGYELDELHNVLITDPLDEDVLFYNGVESLWINKNIYSAINATDVGKSLLAILNAEDTTPVTTKPRGIRINVDNTVSALDVGTQGFLPFYDETDFYIDSPVFTDGTQVIIGDDVEFATGNKLSVVGNLAVDGAYGYHLGTYQVLYRYNATGELRFGTNAANDFTTFFANGIERARLNASGYLGIGLSSPTQPLHVKGVLAYPKIIIDNNSASGGGMFSAYQNGTETAIFGVSGAWLIDNSSDVAIVAARAGQGIQYFTNGSTSEKMGLNADGNLYVGQTPTFVAGATQAVVRGKTGAAFLGVQHYDMSIRGSINTFNSVFQVGTSTFHSVAVIVEDTERARFNSGGRFLLGTTTDNTTDIFQANGSIIATAIKKTGGTSAQFLKADGSVDSTAYGTGSVTSVSATVPTGFAISGSPITTSGTLAITFASGYALPTTVKQSNWDDAYSWVSAFPTQTGNSGKYLTTDGSSLSWGTVTAGVSSFNTRTGAVTLLDTDVTTALGYTPYNGTTNPLNFITSSALSGYVPTSRTLTINGTTYDLSANRAWTISAGSSARNVTTFTATAGQTTFTISGGYTPNLVDVFLNGARLTGADYTATNGTTVVLTTGVRLNDIVDVVNYTDAATSGITGSGTSGYLTKWTGTSVVNSSVIYDNGTNVGIGTNSPFSTNGINLEIKSTSSFPSRLVLTNSSASGRQYFFQNQGDGNFIIYDNTAGSERLRITTDGKIGIGISSPATKLHVYESSTSSTAYLTIQNNRARNAAVYTQTTNGGFYAGTSIGTDNFNYQIYDGVAGAARLTIASSGAATFSSTITASTAIILNAAESSYYATNGALSYYAANNGVYLNGAGSNGWLRLNAAGSENQRNAIDIYGSGLGNLIAFYTTASERLRIDSSGNILVNTTTPSNAGSGRGNITIGGSASAILALQKGGVDRAYVYHDGSNYSINNISGAGGIYMSSNSGGVVLSNGATSWASSSDKRLKNINSYIENAVEKLLSLSAINFSWKSDDSKKELFGLIAQEVENVFPQVIDKSRINTNVLVKSQDETEYLSVRYTELIPVLIKAIQEISAKITLLENK